MATVGYASWNDDDVAGRLRLATHRGRPLATDRLLARLETRLDRRLYPLPVGRPKTRKHVHAEEVNR